MKVRFFNWRVRYVHLAIFVAFFCSATFSLFADSLDKIAKKISAGAKDLQNKKVAVLPFPYHDGRESQGSTIVSERLITKLAERKKLDLIERSLLEKVLKELKLQSSGAIDEQSAKQIGKILGVDAVVSGTLIDLGEKEVEVNARLIKMETGQIIVATSGKIERFWQDQPVKLVKQSEKSVSSVPSQSQTAPLSQPLAEKIVTPQTPPVTEEKPVQESIVLSNRDLRDSNMPPPAPPQDNLPMDWQDDGGILQGPEDMPLVESGFPPEMLQSPEGQQILEGLHLLKSGDGARAEKHFAMLHEEFKDRPKIDAIIQLGYSMSLFLQGQQEKAVRRAREIAQMKEFPRVSALAHFVLARYAEKLGKPEEAQNHYLQIVRRTPFQTRLVRIAGQRLQAVDPGQTMRLGEKQDLRGTFKRR